MHIAIGAKGLAKQVMPLFDKSPRYLFFDDTKDAPNWLHSHLVMHKLEEIQDLIDSGEGIQFSICIGNPKWRKHFYEMLTGMGAKPVNLTSRWASVASGRKEGAGNIILDFALIETDSEIGNGNLINCYAGIFHDVQIGNYNEIMPGAKLLGGVKIGDSCRIGSNATILPEVTICSDVIVGAGAVVIEDITEPGTYVGVPAKRIR